MKVVEEVRRPHQQQEEAASLIAAVTERAGQAERLNRLAHEKVTTALKRFGNEISPTHDEALRELIGSLTLQGLHLRPGRYAYALPCGAGKTQSVVAWVAAAHDLQLNLSVAVAASQIEALCKIKEDLVSAGVPEAMIGLRHSYGSHASLPDTGNDDRPIMLVSHARIRAAREFPVFCAHMGRLRDLLIWDESLMTADAEVLSRLDVDQSIQRILSETRNPTPLVSALVEARAKISREFEAQSAGADPKPILLFEGVDLDAVQAEAKRFRSYGSTHRRAAIQTVKSLVRLAAWPVAIAMTGNGKSGDGLIRYTITVDPELTNIAILDASHPIRKLAHTESIIDGTTAAMRSCKTYDRVQVRQVSLPTGKTTLQADTKRVAALAEQTADVIRGLPAKDPVLIFTFKGDDKKTMLASLQRAVSEAGIDIDETIGGSRRIEWLTWGNETSLSTYSYCRHIILAGVLRRSPLDLSACAAGREDDLCYRLAEQELRDVQLSEMAHCVLQAMSRGSCRTVDEEGRASAMTLTILANIKGLREALADSLPGIDWRGEDDAVPGGRTGQAATLVRDYLRDQSPDVQKVSIRSLKAALGCSLGREAWRKALTVGMVLTRLGCSGSEWGKVGQSVVRRSVQ